MHLLISGKVQGVGFRHFTQKNASTLGLKGWVKNLSNGKVEAMVEGPGKKVDELIEKCKQGPPSAYVKEVQVEAVEQKKSALSEFEIRY
jgi:acylphosphatase